MFKNPLKYQSGGVTQSKEQEAENQLVSAIAEGLGAQPEQVKARLEQIKSNPNEVKELQSALQLMQQDQNAGFQAVLKLFAKPQSAKHGAKIQDFICKHKRGGYVAGCGCKEDGGIVKGQEGIPSINGYRVFPRTWQNNLDGSTSSEQIAVEPNGQAIQRVIIDRSRMTNRDELPIRDTLRLGGYYTPDGFIQDGDITFGREIDPIFDTVNKKKVVKNQEPAGPIPEPDDSYFGTISEDTTNPIRRWIDNKINNNPTLYRTRQGLRNFAQSAPGKVLDFFVPDVTSENGFMSAIVPVGKIGKLGKGSLRRRNYDPFVWEVVAKDPVVLENAKKLGLQEGSSEWADFIEKTAKELDDLARFKKGGKVEKAQWGGITTGNERTNSNNRGQYWEDLTINPEFGRTYRLTIPDGMINGKYISHRSPNGINVIKSTSVLSSDPSIRWSRVFVPGMKDYSWEDFYFNHMKKNVPQRLSNSQRLVPPIYDVKK